MRRFDEGAVVQIAEGLTQLGLGIHHDRAMPGHRLFDRRAGNQQEAQTFGTGLNGDLFAGAKTHQRTVARHVANVQFFPCDFFFQQNTLWAGCIHKGALTFEDIGKGAAVGVDLEGLLDPSRHKDIEILRVCGDAIHRAFFAPEFAHDDFDAGAVIVDDLGDLLAFDILIARIGHLLAGGQVAPQLEAVHLAVDVSLGHLLVQDAGSRGHPLHVTGAQRAGVAQRVAVLHGAGEHIGDGLDPAVGVPGKAAHIVLRVLIAEVIEQQERIQFAGVMKSKGPVQLYTGAFHGRHGVAGLDNRSDGHLESPGLFALMYR